MSDKTENPKAFPDNSYTVERGIENKNGMDLRDYFAIRILQANYSSREQWIASMQDRGTENPYTYVCREAYNLADEMLKERLKHK